MTYLQRPNRSRAKGKRRSVVLAALALIGVALLASSAFLDVRMPHVLERAALAATRPAWDAAADVRAAVRDYVALLSSKRALVLENRRLRDELEAGEQELLLARALRSENEELKGFLGRNESRSAVLAAIIAGPGAAPYDTLLIDVGSQAGIAEGDVVYASGWVALGTVETLFSDAARVELFSAPGREIDVAIGESAIAARALGEGGGNFSVRLPRGIGVEAGDVISIPSYGLNVFGVVEEVIDEDREPFQTVLFKNPVNAASVGWVEVITN